MTEKKRFENLKKLSERIYIQRLNVGQGKLKGLKRWEM